MQPKTWKNPCIELLNNEFHALLARVHTSFPLAERSITAECWDTCKKLLQTRWGAAPWCRDVPELCHAWVSPHWSPRHPRPTQECSWSLDVALGSCRAASLPLTLQTTASSSSLSFSSWFWPHLLWFHTPMGMFPPLAVHLPKENMRGIFVLTFPSLYIVYISCI